jgi:hypothetical protein
VAFREAGMTEAEWLAWEDPRPLVQYLIGTDEPRVQDIDAFPDCRASARKLRMFACACYHRVSHVLPHPEARASIDTAERFADGLVGEAKRVRTEGRLLALSNALEGQWRASRGAERAALQPTHAALALALQALWYGAPKAAHYAPHTAQHHLACILHPDVGNDPAGSPTGKAEARAQCDLLREIIGNPFRPVEFAPEWRTDTAVTLARQMYEAREFSAMPILADALQDAGCDNLDILDHCRDTSLTHVRGCWAVDLVLGKT